jgi:hypothetical protein
MGQYKDSTGPTEFGDHDSGDSGVEGSRTCTIAHVLEASEEVVMIG